MGGRPLTSNASIQKSVVKLAANLSSKKSSSPSRFGLPWPEAKESPITQISQSSICP
ncbi:hypothetical protein [Ornithinimicrobium kibberense]|uniref:hypothetical protein n=1 Tax=Ornithinimicrobium kibberense TaxID=282060 RepID=UPI0036129A23